MQPNRKTIVIFLLLLFSLLTRGGEVVASTSDSTTTKFLFLASDRHEDTTVVTTLMSLLQQEKKPIAYVGLLGDMVGWWYSNPSYQSSQIAAEVHSIYPNATVSILKSGHDDQCIDDDSILVEKCQGIDSSAYYLYFIPQDSFNSEGCIKHFTSWVDHLPDLTKPIFVLSHVSIHYQRTTDTYNAKAPEWHKALNIAATGKETGEQIVRNVFFFHGHNHSADRSEYYYPAGGEMPILSKGNYTNYYTYATAGYLNARRNGTLITLTSDSIFMEKYNDSLGVKPSYADTGGIGFSTEKVAIKRVAYPCNHTIQVDSGYPKTCYDNGITKGIHCTLCHETIVAQDTLWCTGHDTVIDPARTVTCTTDGWTEGSHCNQCQKILVKQDTSLAFGHSWDLYKIIWLNDDYTFCDAIVVCLNDSNHMDHRNCHITILDDEGDYWVRKVTFLMDTSNYEQTFYFPRVETDVDDIYQSDEPLIYTNGNSLIIHNLKSAISLYNHMGQLLFSQPQCENSTSLVVRLSEKGVYLLHAKGKTTKILIR